MWSCRNVTFRGRRTIGDVRVSLVVAGAAVGDVGASLFVASAAFGEILPDSWDALGRHMLYFRTKRVRDDEFMVGSWSERSRIVRALEMTFHVFFVVPWGFIFAWQGAIW